MNKAQLIDSIQKNLGEGATRKCAAAALDAVLTSITTAVKTEKVQIIGFGTFETKSRPARTGHNPKTGATMQIPASKTVAFKASSALKK
ncbi:HU family DNA-binding protein [Akkermansia glycaniphila]|uniref:Prokaryotic integration host factor signature n=1 Tax=Akkermansia glycaniphila TaxID=1679444 RepID=A0A1C7P9N6_9BACT|nr:HU family DNA-binding protein [Akkermansia glycaniphila]MBT9449730.1 HU family DNA-binding protein [Akkermansia glycaniphila]OCA02199.1 DNA-binding protein [Akkermansia glycaniphila]SEH99253.1 prokaryotic integration host factor signature [Akkermansia glycaniphila]